MLKKSDWPKPWFRAPFWGLWAPQNGPKMNFFVCSFRSFKFSGSTIVGCRTSLVQNFFSYWVILGPLRGAKKFQFMWKTSLLILAVALLQSLIDSSLSSHIQSYIQLFWIYSIWTRIWHKEKILSKWMETLE